MFVKKVAAIAVAAFLTLHFAAIQTFCAEAVNFSLECGKLNAGSDLTVICSVNQAPHIGGFVMQIVCEKEAFSYVEKTFSASNSIMDDADVNYNESSGMVTVVWETAAGSGLTEGGDLFSLKFRADKVLSKSEYNFSLKVAECYTDDAVPKNIRISANGCVANYTVSGAVAELISKINSIAPVTYTDECLQKIAAAEQMYKELLPSQRRQVTNYSDLISFRAQYDKLAQQALQNEEKAAAQAYRDAYAAILSKTVSDLALEDKEAVNTALDAWNSLPTNAQKVLLIDEKNHLNKLKTRIDELVKMAEDEAKREQIERELKEEAAGFKREFDAKWGQILSLTVDTVTSDYAEVLSLAKAEADTYCIMNSYCNEYLKDEITLIDSLIEKLGEDSETGVAGITVSSFLKNYGYLSALSPENVTANDAEDIKLAYQFIQLLSADAVSKLGNMPSHIEELMLAVDNLEESGEADIQTAIDDALSAFKASLPATSIETITNTVMVPGGTVYDIQSSDGETVYAVSKSAEIHTIFILCIVTLVSAVVFGISLTAYLCFQKKRRGEVNL